jgi:ribosome-binding ATPase YchF (GTP1/OBG family)
VGDDDFDGSSDHAQAVAKHADATGSRWIAICSDMESELRGMEDDEREVFMADLGLTSSGLDRLIQATYGLLGLQTYYTAGPKEIRAWTIHKGDKGPKAAGEIHTDFEKGFIRVEVYSIENLVEYATEAAIKAAGKLRTEGREYVMREDDVCNFLIGR